MTLKRSKTQKSKSVPQLGIKSCEQLLYCYIEVRGDIPSINLWCSETNVDWAGIYSFLYSLELASHLRASVLSRTSNPTQFAGQTSVAHLQRFVRPCLLVHSRKSRHPRLFSSSWLVPWRPRLHEQFPMLE